VNTRIGNQLRSKHRSGTHERPLMFCAVLVAVVLHALLVWFWMNYEVADRPLAALAGRPLSSNGIEVTMSIALPATPVRPAPPSPPKPVVTQLVKPPPTRTTAVRQRPVLAATRTTTAPDTAAAASVPIQPPIDHPAQPPAAAEAASAAPSLPAPVVPQLNLPGAEVARSVSQLACNIPQPRYPPAAKRLAQEGTVTLRVTVHPSGDIRDVVIASTSGYELLDAAAVAALRQGRCQPHVENGVPVSATAELPVGFSLKR